MNPTISQRCQKSPPEKPAFIKPSLNPRGLRGPGACGGLVFAALARAFQRLKTTKSAGYALYRSSSAPRRQRPH